jgi:hypothetical protein
MISMISTLITEIGTLAPESAAAVAESVSQILVAGLSSLPAARRTPVSQLTALHREQIKALVRERLRDPDFGVAEIAARLRLSPSTLYRAWGGEACSLPDWIWAQRLEAARRASCGQRGLPGTPEPRRRRPQPWTRWLRTGISALGNSAGKESGFPARCHPKQSVAHRLRVLSWAPDL